MATGGERYLRLLARTIPKESLLKGLGNDKLDRYNHWSKECLDKANFVGMPVRFDHKADKKHPIMGRCVQKLSTDSGSVMTLLEVPFKKPEKGTFVEDSLKVTIAHLVENGFFNDVSMGHRLDFDYDQETDSLIINKYGEEISVTQVGGREGSSILDHYWSDTPFLNESEYTGWTPEMCKGTTIAPFEQQLLDQAPTTVQASITNLRKKMSALPTNEELATLRKEIEAMKAAQKAKETEIERLKRQAAIDKEKADKYDSQRVATENAGKQEALANQQSIYDAAMKLLESITAEGDNLLDPTDKNVAAGMLSDLKEAKEPAMASLSNALGEAGRDAVYTKDDLQTHLSQMVKPLAVFSRYGAMRDKRMEAMDAELTQLRQRVGGAATASAPAGANAAAPGSAPFDARFEPINLWETRKKRRIEEMGGDDDLPAHLK
jgi:hypothetical protein